MCSGRDIERQPQHVLIGFAQTVETMSTISECLELCFRSFEKGLGYVCRSIMYFYDVCFLFNYHKFKFITIQSANSRRKDQSNLKLRE